MYLGVLADDATFPYWTETLNTEEAFCYLVRI